MSTATLPALPVCLNMFLFVLFSCSVIYICICVTRVVFWFIAWLPRLGPPPMLGRFGLTSSASCASVLSLSPSIPLSLSPSLHLSLSLSPSLHFPASLHFRASLPPSLPRPSTSPSLPLYLSLPPKTCYAGPSETTAGFSSCRSKALQASPACAVGRHKFQKVHLVARKLGESPPDWQARLAQASDCVGKFISMARADQACSANVQRGSGAV